jgi:SAM-dependent methyltransferase
MSFEHILGRVDEFFTGKIGEFGPTHRGVDWNSRESQELRFEQVMKIVRDPAADFSLIDYGCGYGALVEYLDRRGLRAQYTGFDVSAAMIEQARKLSIGDGRRAFTTSESELAPADYVVATGIFNKKMDIPDEQWQTYMEEIVDRFDHLALKGFAFDVLTLYSDVERRRPDLHYADPLYWFDRCKRKYAKHVALLHDYPLWEFTILVRKQI